MTWKFWKPKKESIDTLPRSLFTSQQSIETEQYQNLWMRPQWGILHQFNLQEYTRLYLFDAFSKAVVDCDVNLTVSPLVFESSNSDVNSWMEDWCRKLDMGRVVWELQRDVSLYGFAIAEMLGDAGTLQSSNEIVAIKRVDPRFIFIQKDMKGRIEKYHQRWSHGSGQMTSGLLDTELDPYSIIYIHSLSCVTSYGQSILQSLKTRLQNRAELIEATTLAHKKHANAINHYHYATPPDREELKAEIQTQQSELHKTLDAIYKQHGTDLITGGVGQWEYQRIGPNELPDATNIIKEITNEIIIGAGYSPQMLGLGQDQKSNESVRYSVNSIITRQQNLMAQLHAHLFSKLPFLVADCPADTGDDIRVSMESPTAEQASEMAQAESVRITNIGMKLRMGVIDEDDAAQEMGYEQWKNKGQLEKFLEGNNGDINQRDPNALQQTRKSIDTLGNGNGKELSNNPSGEKGND